MILTSKKVFLWTLLCAPFSADIFCIIPRLYALTYIRGLEPFKIIYQRIFADEDVIHKMESLRIEVPR